MFLNVKDGSSDIMKSSGLCTGEGEVVVLIRYCAVMVL
jgi:hypothetical protein